MRITQLLVALIYILQCSSQLQSQNSITIRPFWDFHSTAVYEQKYVMWGEGKDMIDTIRFSHRFTAEMTPGKEGVFIVSFTSDTTEQALPANVDGDVHAVLRFLAVDLSVEVDAYGKVISLVNKDDFLTQMDMIPDTPDDELNLILNSLIETTYGLILTGIGRTFSIPFSVTKDSIITNTITPAKIVMKIEESLKTDGKHIKYLREIHQNVPGYTMKESYGDFVYLPSSVVKNETVMLSSAGLMTSMYSTNRSDSEGMKIIRDGRESMNTGRMVQNVHLTLTLIE